ncbi:uncharacterized protein LOC132734721 isoform X7 [Ruditapes philippinarum]|uniref:uncharacterized protein LOC132734721 isoform X7 n=1 Tax=Ruditapes philippinarum TaxID=129788 RepID=UPI00295AA6B8|nr:uncharacterized protein LOC132734721 isoform X7 [Ruditapes philippinarum]
MTLDDLNRYLQTIDRTTGIQRPKFTREQINRMIDDTNRGRYYNQDGKLAVGNEPRMTLDDLNRYLQTIDRTTGIQRPKFTREQINRMIDDTNRGRYYNQDGKLAVGNEPRMTLDDLNRYLQTIDRTTGIQRPKFTREQINRMIQDTNRGRYYNQDGKLAVGNEPRMTLDDLNRYLQDIGRTTDVQRPKFTREQINRMIEDTNRGRYYNQDGKLVVGNEPRMTLDDLKRYLQTIDRTTGIQRPKFTREQINRMIEDTNRGRYYNLDGKLAVGNEPRMTLDDLNRYLQDIGRTTGIQRPKFTREQINRMIDDTNRGRYYNQDGKLVVGNEPRMTLDDLNRYLQEIGRTNPQRSRFTRQQILDMIEGLKRGLYYNLDGKEAFGNEPRLTLDDLNRYLQTLDNTAGIPGGTTQYTFTLDDINRMLTGIGQGVAYNIQGRNATAGEPTLTKAQLKQMAKDLLGSSPPEPTRRNYTVDEISAILDGMDNNKRYNYQGLEASPGDQYLDRGYLTKRLVDAVLPNYNIQDVQNMLYGMQNGSLYNYRGRIASPGERTWLKDQLELLLIFLLGLRYENVAANKSADMSSVYHPSWTADKGVDGNRNQNMFFDSCFHTAYDKDPYFIIDLGAIYDLDTLVIFNRQDCCEDRANNLEVSTGLTLHDMTIQDVIIGPVSSTALLRFKPKPSARYIKIQKKGVNPSFFHLCEVELYGSYNREDAENIALGKRTELSSLYQNNNNYAGNKGNDGNPNGQVSSGSENSCFHTNQQLQPYWMIDLGDLYDIHRIVLHNRLDCCSERAHDLVILAGPTHEDTSPIYYHAGSLGPLKEILLPPGQHAQFIKIQINDTLPEYLHLCEVEIYGTYSKKGSENVALNKTTEMSSLFQNNPIYASEKGNDGNSHGHIIPGSDNTCFHTEKDIRPYWKVDLGAVYDLESIVLHNRLDCCGDRAHNIEILAGYSDSNLVPVYYNAGILGPIETFYFPNNTDAQIIMVRINDLIPEILHLCEVEIYGVYKRPDLCGISPCLNGGNCTNIAGDNLCVCPVDWIGKYCQISADNIAYGKPTQLSSLYLNDPIFTGEKGNDGDSSGNLMFNNNNTCFHTNKERRPYWQVDLGAVYDLRRIVLHNRLDCCTQRAHDIEILAGLTPDDMMSINYIPGNLGTSREITLPSGQPAQFVRIQINDLFPEYLHLCEVEIYGSFSREDLCAISPCLNGGTCTNRPGDFLCMCPVGWSGNYCQIDSNNIAYGKPTEMSSLYRNDINFAGEKGNDGDSSGNLMFNANNTCFHTDRERRPYWKVDLGDVYDLQRMVLYNRQDCCSERAHDIEILAGLTHEDLNPIYYHAGILGNVQEIQLPAGTEAKVVMIHIKDLRPEYLHLCEVQIYGTFMRKDRCKPNPCKNGGTCTNQAGTRICNCPIGWGGIFCLRDESQTGPTYPTVTDSPEPPSWNGSRVDPAVCRRAKCNLPICYVPYPSDCKSYVVCQRTAIGSYVAWKMRCAFGSYWGFGRTWTCERVEDLAKQGYICPNDPCRNSSITKYADKEILNCRTFWQCENGVSKPACCSAGKRFDQIQLRCVDDPLEVCRAPCPLKRDGCSVPGARTQPFYDGNCRTYWDCQSGHAHPLCCMSGTSYDVDKGRCKDDPMCTDSCPSEYKTKVCGKITGDKPVQSYALTDGLCRTYMKCTAEGFDDPYCCRQDYYYDVTTGQCELVEDLFDPCRQEMCPRGYKEDCRLSAIVGRPTKYFDNDAMQELSCAPGTKFAPDICTCDGSSLNNICKAEVWTKFDHLEEKWSVKNYGDGWISVFGEMSKNRTEQGVTYGKFDGSGGMEVWRYDHTAFREVTLEITFQPVASGSSKQILVSNCMSVDNGKASFEVSLNPRTSNIEFRGTSKFDAVFIELPYDRQGWNTFKLFFDGKHIVGLVESGNNTSISSKNLRGKITAGIGALKFGPCLDDFSMPKHDGFTGFISEVIFSKCIDENGRAVIQKHVVPDIPEYKRSKNINQP